MISSKLLHCIVKAVAMSITVRYSLFQIQVRAKTGHHVFHICFITVLRRKQSTAEWCHTTDCMLHLWRTSFLWGPQHFTLHLHLSMNTTAHCIVGVHFQSIYIYLFLLSQEQTFLRCSSSGSISKAALYITFHLCLWLSFSSAPQQPRSLPLYSVHAHTRNCHIPDLNASQWV